MLDTADLFNGLELNYCTPGLVKRIWFVLNLVCDVK